MDKIRKKYSSFCKKNMLEYPCINCDIYHKYMRRENDKRKECFEKRRGVI